MTESGFKKAVTLISATALAATAWIVARAFVFPDEAPRPVATEAAGAPEAAPATRAAPTELTRTILANDIFGLKPVAGSADKPREAPKPAEIDMELAGTVVSVDGQHSVAFLRDKANKAQKPYGLGATVKDARIKDIGRNFVILERQGREEILSMKP